MPAGPAQLEFERVAIEQAIAALLRERPEAALTALSSVRKELESALSAAPLRPEWLVVANSGDHNS